MEEGRWGGGGVVGREMGWRRSGGREMGWRRSGRKGDGVEEEW